MMLAALITALAVGAFAQDFGSFILRSQLTTYSNTLLDNTVYVLPVPTQATLSTESVSLHSSISSPVLTTANAPTNSFASPSVSRPPLALSTRSQADTTNSIASHSFSDGEFETQTGTFQDSQGAVRQEPTSTPAPPVDCVRPTTTQTVSLTSTAVITTTKRRTIEMLSSATQPGVSGTSVFACDQTRTETSVVSSPLGSEKGCSCKATTVTKTIYVNNTDWSPRNAASDSAQSTLFACPTPVWPFYNQPQPEPLSQSLNPTKVAPIRQATPGTAQPSSALHIAPRALQTNCPVIYGGTSVSGNSGPASSSPPQTVSPRSGGTAVSQSSSPVKTGSYFATPTSLNTDGDHSNADRTTLSPLNPSGAPFSFRPEQSSARQEFSNTGSRVCSSSSSTSPSSSSSTAESSLWTCSEWSGADDTLLCARNAARHTGPTRGANMRKAAAVALYVLFIHL